jgi:phage/plasmid-associated DNA primase
MLAATRTTTDQLARTATVVTNATGAAQATLTGLLRDPLAEILGNEGATGKSTIELVIRRPGGAE